MEVHLLQQGIAWQLAPAMARGGQCLFKVPSVPVIEDAHEGKTLGEQGNPALVVGSNCRVKLKIRSAPLVVESL